MGTKVKAEPLKQAVALGAVAAIAVLIGACSLVLDLEQCVDDGDCPDAEVCEDGLCRGDGDNGGTDGPNLCGGDEALELDGESVEPGDPCGACGDGIALCDGENDVRCVAATAANECGGCAPLSGRVGEPCGRCGHGEWQCDGEEELHCAGGAEEGETNACGGCAELEHELNFECETDDGEGGIWKCIGPEEIRCAPFDENACGGDEGDDLLAQPGTVCGECDQGAYACDGTDDVYCEGAQLGVNDCGGCEALSAAVGTECGICDGEWVCDGDSEVVCAESPQNNCGGCGALDGEPGQSCGDDGEYECQHPETVTCVE